MRWTPGAMIVVALWLAVPCLASAQDSRSAPLAAQLSQALVAAGLDAVGARDPGSANGFVAALYLKGLELLVVATPAPHPESIREAIDKRAYRDAYVLLNAGTDLKARLFFEDAGADGLRATPNGFLYDTFQDHGRLMAWNGKWREQELSEAQYLDAFRRADELYAHCVELLLKELASAQPSRPGAHR